MGLFDDVETWKRENPEEAVYAKSGSLAEATPATAFMRDGAKEGDRNNSFMRYACWLRSHGMNSDEIEDLLFLAEKAHDTGLQPREISTIARSAARYAVKPENRNPLKEDIMTVRQMGEKWKAQHAIGADFKTNFERLDKAMYALFPGETLTIAGRSGAYKTTFGIEISKRIADSLGGKVFFASLEMNAEALFFRMGGMQISEADQQQQESAEIARRLNGEDFEKTITKYNGRAVSKITHQPLNRLKTI